DAFGAKATVAAWKQKPSYAVISKQDRMINPDLERFMAKRAQSQVIELPGSHAIFLSHAREVAALIEKGASAAKEAIVSQCLLLARSGQIEPSAICPLSEANRTRRRRGRSWREAREPLGSVSDRLRGHLRRRVPRGVPPSRPARAPSR